MMHLVHHSCGVGSGGWGGEWSTEYLQESRSHLKLYTKIFVKYIGALSRERVLCPSES